MQTQFGGCRGKKHVEDRHLIGQIQQAPLQPKKGHAKPQDAMHHATALVTLARARARQFGVGLIGAAP